MGKVEGKKIHDDPPKKSESGARHTSGHPNVRHQAGDMGEAASMKKAHANLRGSKMSAGEDTRGDGRLKKYKE